MNITEPFVLQPDVLLMPCSEIGDDVRRRISFEEGDYTLWHRHGRKLAQVIDGDTAALLALFRQPRTIVDAVIENSRALKVDPKRRLEELLPHLGSFLGDGVLVPAAADAVRETRPQLERGAMVDGWTVLRCASLIADSEVYQLRRGDDEAALKIARVRTAAVARRFTNETEILRRLDGTALAPRLIAAGSEDGKPYLIMEWLDGVDAGVAAAQRRGDRAALIELCASIAAAYARLHEQGVLHGDVHPRNAIAGRRVALIDFGYARRTDEPSRRGRGGVQFFFEPEFFAARRRGRGLAPSPAGEQYGVGALLYFLITGRHYVDFRYDREEMERQAMTDPPVPFAAHGIAPWPEVEAILFRALEKDPARRYPAMREMAAALAALRDETAREAAETPVGAQAVALLEMTLQSFQRGGAMFTTRYRTPPTASVNLGCAGAAVGLLRIAEVRGDPKLLAAADVWRSRAAALLGSNEAFDGVDRERVGEVTPYHTESGVHAAAAMIAAAMGDAPAQRRAIRAFLRASRTPCSEIDLTLGRSGSLLAAAMLLEISAGLREAAALRAFGAETMSGIWRELDARPPLDQSPRRTYFGMAHGWAGYLHASMRWCAASGDALPPRLVERLHQYAALRIAAGRGVFWPRAVGKPLLPTYPGWCHGTAGQVFLFTLAHRLFGDAEWLDLAERSAWNNWDERRRPADLCCGTAGRAYALLNLYKHTGATEWLARARHLANHAAANASATAKRANSLWKGELGVAVLIADLESPENARMPFFE